MGDARVWNTAVGTMGMVNQATVIDAHTAKTGDFQEARQVNNKTLYFTESGAQAYDQLKGDLMPGQSLKWECDPNAVYSFFFGDWAAGKEQHSGNV